MTKALDRLGLIELVGGDSSLVELLIVHELIVETTAGYDARDIDRVLVAHTVMRELEVNVQGLEVILHLREALGLARLKLREVDEAK